MVRVVRRSIVVALAVGVTVAGAAGTARATTTSSGLASGARLASGQMLVSPGGLYSLTMQTDGNLVERTTKRSGAVWTTDTPGHAGATLTMQTDGNLVLRATSGQAVWATNTVGNPGATLRIQDDGNIVVAATSGRAVWNKGVDKPPAPQPSGVLRVGQSWLDSDPDHHSASGEFQVALLAGSMYIEENIRPGGEPFQATTWSRPDTGGSGAERLTLQTDGNLVLYVGGRAAWTTSTSGRGAAYFIVQDDGNLVLRSTSGGTLWTAGTGKKLLSTGSTLASGQQLRDVDAATYRIRAAATMQPDGNFVFSRDGHAVWSSGTSTPGSHLTVQTDGNMVIVAPDGRAVWSTNTAGTGNGNYLFLDYFAPLSLENIHTQGAVWTAG